DLAERLLVALDGGDLAAEEGVQLADHVFVWGRHGVSSPRGGEVRSCTPLVPEGTAPSGTSVHAWSTEQRGDSVAVRLGKPGVATDVLGPCSGGAPRTGRGPPGTAGIRELGGDPPRCGAGRGSGGAGPSGPRRPRRGALHRCGLRVGVDAALLRLDQLG